MRITITQARQRLADLGFTMNPDNVGANWGRMTPELFTYTGFHILSIPFRDVFISKAKMGWYITSHIKFNARKFRARRHNTSMMEIKNIFGMGRTLKDAIQDFENNFNFQVHGLR